MSINFANEGIGPGAWIGNGYCTLQQDGYDDVNKVYTQTRSYINTTGSGQGIGILWQHYDQTLPPSYVVGGMVRTSLGVLVTLMFNPANNRVYGCNSRDKGKTWTMDSIFVEEIPALQIPPALTVLGDTVVACWADSGDQPNFAVSFDSGMTWT